MVEGLKLAEETKSALQHLNQSITSVVKAVTAPWSLIPGEIPRQRSIGAKRPAWSVIKAVIAVGEGVMYILRVLWAVICRLSTSTTYDAVCSHFQWPLTVRSPYSSSVDGSSR